MPIRPEIERQVREQVSALSLSQEVTSPESEFAPVEHDGFLVFFTSSLRKRVILGLQIWWLHDLKPEHKPAFFEEVEKIVGSVNWREFITGTNPGVIFDFFNQIPNGNGAVDSVHVLGVWNNQIIMALPNGGETHQKGATPQQEAVNKVTEFGTHELARVFGPKVAAVGMDAVIATGRTSLPGEKRILGKPAEAIPELKDRTNPRYRELLLQYIADQVGIDESVTLENLAATAVRTIREVSGSIIETAPVASVALFRHIAVITEELLERIVDKLNAEAAGLQLLQWLLIEQRQWYFLAESVADLEFSLQQLQPTSTRLERRRALEVLNFFVVCEVLGVQFSTALQLLDSSVTLRYDDPHDQATQGNSPTH